MGFYAVDYYLDRCQLSGNEKLAMVILAHHADDKSGTCFPGVDRIAEKLNISKRGAQNILSKLRSDGHIEIDYNSGINTGTGKTNLYRLTAYCHFVEGVNATSPLDAQGVNADTQGVKCGTQGVNVGSPKQSVEHTEDQEGDPRAHATPVEPVTLSPSPLDNAQFEYLPGLPDPRRRSSKQNTQRGEIAERFSEANRLGLTPEQFRLLVDALLLGFGKKAMVDAGNDSALYFAQDLTLKVMRMSENYRTPEGVQAIFRSWYTNDWRGQKGEKPTSAQFEEHASAMVDGAVGRPEIAEAKQTITAKQWCLREYGTDAPTLALGIPESQWRARYEQAVRVH